MSRQRVRQIIDARSRRWFRRQRSEAEHLACSFCDSPKPDVEWVISGPGIHICERCVANARKIREEASSRKTGLILAGAESGCGFCGKPSSQGIEIVEPAVQPAALPRTRKQERIAICNLCLALCDEIAGNEQVRRR